MHCLVSMLEKLRPVVCGLTLQWSSGVPMNSKEYHVAAVEKKNLASPCSRILMDLAVDHQREDTRHLNFPHTSDP